jgi:methionyl-tRNA synthetase|tara:strand:+ start:1329 stop:2822 length:1494 start_codon:yes stop_codon:yes gene_type:complete
MNKYLTTPIYYASGTPHLGHAYTTLVADCYRRYFRLLGHDVKLISGTDEHGQKIERAALNEGTDTAEFIQARSDEFRELWEILGIELDAFVRTTDSDHVASVLPFWKTIVAKGDIYLGQYEGLYCVECEQYFTTGDECPVHRKPLEAFSEESYFFRLSRYQSRLIEHIESHDEFILPRERRNEVLSLLKGTELHDLSISRTSTNWGIPVPRDNRHVMYVWIDALVSYLSALDKDDFSEFWPSATHFIGKDILIFHAVYWPALLLSAGIELPRSLKVNGWLTIEGKKIAKSDPDTIVDPADLIDEIGTDGLSYFFLKGVPFGGDVDFVRQRVRQLLNADLANNVGNLISRFTALVERNFGGVIDVEDPVLLERDRGLLAELRSGAENWREAFERAQPHVAAQEFAAAAASINRYLQHEEPWLLIKAEENRARVAVILLVVHAALSSLCVLGLPFVPVLVAKVRAALCLQGDVCWSSLGELRNHIRTQKVEPVYPRLSV